MDNRLQALERRIARAERQLWALRGLALVGLVVGVAGMTAQPAISQMQRFRAPFVVVGTKGQKLMEVVEAEQGGALRVYDQNGLGRIALHASDQDQAALLLFAPNRNNSVALLAGQLGGSARFKDPAGDTGIEIAAAEDESRILAFKDTDVSRLEIVATSDESRVSVRSRKGVPVSNLQASSAGTGVSIFNEGETLTAFLATGAKGGGTLALGDPDGKITARLPVVEDQKGLGRAPAPELPLIPRQNIYLGVGKGHWVREVSGSGRFVELEDGSLWEIEPLSRIDSNLWLPIDNITVAESKNPSFPYLLINTDDGEMAEARLISR